MSSRLLASLAFAFVVGCGGGHAARGPVVAHGEGGPLVVAEVSDDAFAGTMRTLLTSEPGSAEREKNLAGVLARQMSRAVQRFKSRAPDRGLLAVTSALSLVRTGELRQGMLGDNGRDALRAAVRDLSAHGDEGKARALFEILGRMWPDSERADSDSHIAALHDWTRDEARAQGPMGAAGALESAAVSRRLVEPSQAARDEASVATTDWIARAIAIHEKFLVNHVRPSQQEAAEAWRALGTSPIVLCAIYLRDGDAKGVVSAIDRAQARELVRPDLMHALEAVADKPDSSRWLDVIVALHPPHDSEGGDSPTDMEDAFGDHDALNAATLGAALEAYRLDPTSPDAAGTVAASLESMGMGEASPAVLFDAVKAHRDPKIVGGSLAITMHAIGSELDADDADGARRVYRAALPLLEIADDPKIAKLVQPPSARVRAMTGEIELREGRLVEARALLTQSLATSKSGGVLFALARIDRHDQKPAAAADDLHDALAQHDAVVDVALRGEILVLTSDLAHEKGDDTQARALLTDALHTLRQALGGAEGDQRARLERTLARVYDRFGADQQAEHALDRALDAASRNKSQAAATVGQIVARAFVRGDLKGARAGLQRGLAADLDAEDLVYYALWVRFLEKQLHAPTDGVADRVFASALDAKRWTSRLAAFGAGQIKGDQLIADAATPPQKTEALFYAALEKRAAGDAHDASDGLAKVVASDGVDLIEVGIAREVLAGSPTRISGAAPPEVNQP